MNLSKRNFQRHGCLLLGSPIGGSNSGSAIAISPLESANNREIPTKEQSYILE